MKKAIVLWMLLLLSGAGFGQISDVLAEKTSEYTLTQKNQYTIIENKSGGTQYNDQIGAPQLPVVTRRYYLPPGSIVTGIQFTTGNKDKMGEMVNLFPNQLPCPLNGQPCPDSVSPDPNIYGSSEIFPAKNGKIESDQNVLGFHVVTVSVCPFVYVPKDKKLYHYDEVFIKIQYTVEQADYQIRMTQKRSQLNRNFVASMVQNADAVPTELKTAYQILDNQINTDKVFIPWKPTAYGNVPDYIIITNEALKPFFDSLATYKTQRGMPTLVTTVEQIYANYQGCDSAEKIRNYLKAAHHYWGAGLYVLLGGDTGIVPSRIGTNDGSPRYTDMYYCDVYRPSDPNYNWNSDNDSDFTDDLIEMGPDNFIGRAPVDTPEEAHNFVNKIISYESLANVSDTAYVNNDLFIGPYFFVPPYCSGDHGQKWANNTIVQAFWNSATNINKWKLYDDSNPSASPVYCNQIPGNEELSRSVVLDRLNNGHPENNKKFHIIGHVDHGSPYGIGVSSGMKGDSLYREDMDALSNGTNYQILYTGCCDAGEMDKDCFAEHFVNNPNGGGVAALANSGYGYTSSKNQESEFFKSIYDPNQVNGYLMGMAFQKSRLAYSNSRAIVNNLNLFGEPSMAIWTNTPQTIALSAPASITINNAIANNLPVTINALTQPATITLYKFNTVTQMIEVYASQVIPAGGTNAVFTLNPDTEGVMVVTATAKNYLPATANVNILLPQAHLYVTGYSIVDANGNGIVEQGESVSLMVNLTNSGNTAISGINATLSCNPVFASVTGATATYGQINPGQTVQVGAYTFVAQISNGTIEFPDFIEFFLNITASGNYAHLDNFFLDFRNPVLNLGARTMSANGTVINSFTLGQPVDLDVAIANIGNIATGPLTATLSSPLVAAGYIELLNANSAYTNIATGSSAHNSPAFGFKLIQPHTGPKPFTLTLTNTFGQVWTFNFDLSEPLPPLISNFHFTSTNSQILLQWNAIANIQGYNIYRSDTEDGTYSQINDFVVSAATYNDTGVAPTTVYYYKIAVVTLSGNQRPLNQIVTNDNPPKQGYKAWTSLNFHGGFPAELTGNNSCNSSPTLFDVDNDGKKEIFVNCGNWIETAGKIMGFKESGQEMFNIDGNETTVSGFAVTNIGMMPNSAVGDLDNDGHAEVLSIGRNNNTNSGKLYVYQSTDNNGDSLPDPFWNEESIDFGWRVWRNPVLYDVDGNGFLDIIVVDEHQKVYVYDKDKNLMPGWPIQVPGNGDYSMGHIAVADLDHDGRGEIALGVKTASGTRGGIFIWHDDGSPFTANPFKLFADNERADGGIVFADIDHDSNYELLVTTRTLNTGKVYAFKLDGTPVNAVWNGTVTFSCTSGAYSDHLIPRIAVGDLNADGDLEIAFGSAGALYLLNKNGEAVANFPRPITNIFDNAPALADIDNDGEAEIVLNDNGILKAFNYDGTSCSGFPIESHDASTFAASPSIADLNGDGKNEIAIAAGNGNTFVYDTDGNSNQIEWGSYRGNPYNTGTYGTMCSGSTLDLYIKDHTEDTGVEPNAVTEYMWNSDNIWVRHADDNGTEHQNPEYSGGYNFIKVRVINRSCVASTGNEPLTLYWAKASSSLGYPNPWFGGVLNPDTGASMGSPVGTLMVPVLQPGEEVVLSFPWQVPDPADYGNDGDQWHFCLLARIDAETDPMTTAETWDLNANVRNNNNIAWKNVTVIDVEPNNTSDPGGVIAVGNPFGYPRDFYLEVVASEKETGKPLFEEAEVTLAMDDMLYKAWYRGGFESTKLGKGQSETIKIIDGNHAKLDNLKFEANEIGKLKLGVNFLTKELTEKSHYVLHLIQHDKQTGDIIGGETFEINKQNRKGFTAKTEEELQVDKNQPLTISAEDINEPALYNWYDSHGNLISEGKNLQIANAVAEKYKLEVISNLDGFKDYSEVRVTLKPNRLEGISPNPASSNIQVRYKLNDATSAYLMVVSYYITNGISNNYVLDLDTDAANLDISNYPGGFYKVVLVANGQIVDAKILFKQ